MGLGSPHTRAGAPGDLAGLCAHKAGHGVDGRACRGVGVAAVPRVWTRPGALRSCRIPGEHVARTGVGLVVGGQGKVTAAGGVAHGARYELAAVPPHKPKGPLAPRGRRDSDKATSPISCTASVPKRSANACTHSSGARVTP